MVMKLLLFKAQISGLPPIGWLNNKCCYYLNPNQHFKVSIVHLHLLTVEITVCSAGWSKIQLKKTSAHHLFRAPKVLTKPSLSIGVLAWQALTATLCCRQLLRNLHVSLSHPESYAIGPGLLQPQCKAEVSGYNLYTEVSIS